MSAAPAAPFAFASDGPARENRRGIRRIAIVGGESSGKSTLVHALARRYDEPYVDEYGRTLWEAQGGHTGYDDLARIGRRHVADEDEALARARRWIFVDTTPLTTLWYALDGHGKADPELAALAWRRYDLVLVCAPDFAFVQDGTRSSEDFRVRHDRWLRATLRARGVDHHEVRGPVAARVARVAALLDPLLDIAPPTAGAPTSAAAAASMSTSASSFASASASTPASTPVSASASSSTSGSASGSVSASASMSSPPSAPPSISTTVPVGTTSATATR